MAQSLPLLAFVIATLTSCAQTLQLQPGAPKIVEHLSLAPYASHEDCMTLSHADRLDYRFDSDAPVTFNIHYQESNATVMPITRDRVVADSGLFAPALAENYCLTWEAGAQGATISYRIVLRKVGT